MPTIQHKDATIYYEEYGSGFPILTFAPAGVMSTIEVWSKPMAPINPITEWSKHYRVIVMDQRNAGGQSHAPLTPQYGWPSYESDHVAVLDHLRIKRCHLYGQCIGGSFIFSLLKNHPDRVASAVIAQAIGRVGPLKPGRAERFNTWAKGLADSGTHPEINEALLDTVYQNMYGAGFVYSADRAFVASCQTPCLTLAGNDDAHPYPISEEISRLLPKNEGLIKEWKSGQPLVSAKTAINAFWAKHTP